MAYLLVIINVFIMTSGQLLFKRSADFINANPGLRFPMTYISNKWFYLAISLFVISTFVWTQALRKLPLSVAYPIASFAYVLTVFGASYFFNEKITHQSIVGVLFIMFGISLTALA